MYNYPLLFINPMHKKKKKKKNIFQLQRDSKIANENHTSNLDVPKSNPCGEDEERIIEVS